MKIETIEEARQYVEDLRYEMLAGVLEHVNRGKDPADRITSKDLDEIARGWCLLRGIPVDPVVPS